eukprot:3160257-Pleurochrysis_carterae.AAC.1
MRERANPGRRTALSCGATASAGRGGEGSEGGDGGAEGGASLSSSDSSVRLAPMLFERLRKHWVVTGTSAAAGSVEALGLPGAMGAAAVVTARPST